MPTPFSHLVIAQELLAPPAEAGARAEAALAPEVRAALAAEPAAFLLGNIAPDAQTVTGQPREATHFFPVPLDGAPPAHQKLFERHPALARAVALPRPQAAFIAGYLAHLALDQLWVADIFEPVFGPEQRWGTFPERLYLHNALRAHCDSADVRRLPASTSASLSAAAPEAWLPFVPDAALRRWRDEVAGQLAPGAARTVEVFAARMRADSRALGALVNSPDEMRRRVFSRVSAARLDQYWAAGRANCARQIQAYWMGALG